MQTSVKLSQYVQTRLICPDTKAKLDYRDNQFVSAENKQYPVIDGIPILICDDKSLFSINDFESRKETTFGLQDTPIKDFLNGLIPTVSINLKSEHNYQRLSDLLPDGSTILILGGSIRGEGMEALYSRDSLDIVNSDVSFGPDASLICDGHDIPFEADSFDCVIAQAVLEHVLDPTRCASEIHRVLKDDGIVYAETPFMQQVHMGEYDFTRFTHLGHRRLFRQFDEIDSGPTAGPGTALAWAWVYLFRCFSTKKWPSRMLSAFAHFTSFFWKYLDHFLLETQGGYDAASGLYFLGKKSDKILDDHDLIKQFKGIDLGSAR